MVDQNYQKISKFNRLIAHTRNFVISGYGAFTPGYFLIISKDFLPSFGLIEEKQLSELIFLIKIFKRHYPSRIKENRCQAWHVCLYWGLDRAHIHIISIPNETKKNIKEAINLTLYKHAGIEYREYNNYKPIFMT